MSRSLRILVLVFLAGSSLLRAGDNGAVSRIAFGSCNRHDLPQPLWEPISAFRPQIWIWLGDNIYGDTEDMAVLEEKWKLQKSQPSYAAFRAFGAVIEGVWDDHDYGVNDGGRDYPAKTASQKLFLDFLDVPTGDPRRSHEGIYSTRTFGPPEREVRLILLDVRTHRDKPRTGGDILGTAQWEWLEGVLANSRSVVHLIASGSQILPSEHRFEKWADYPASRERLLGLLESHRIANVFMISGDRHHAEISQLATDSLFLTEVTSSGMTHSLEKNTGEPNALRIGRVFGGLNFGTLELDWESAAATASIRDRSGRPVEQVTVPLRISD